jgi:peptidoglycan/xylan/chitin deacetylase (PgdA/CDA1 family)
VIVTTSWDDGDPADLKVAELLESRNIPGTFYVPITYEGRPLLTPAELRSLVAGRCEIGAHGLSHRLLPTLNDQELTSEVADCKNILEQTLSREVHMFCYPRGRYDARVLQRADQSGYIGARTARMLRIDRHFARFEMPTTVQAYPHTNFRYLRNIVRSRTSAGAFNYFSSCYGKDWVTVGKRLFDEALLSRGYWHLYGHSWEIESLGLWTHLTELLDYVAHRPETIYATNSDVINLIHTDRLPSKQTAAPRPAPTAAAASTTRSITTIH